VSDEPEQSKETASEIAASDGAPPDGPLPDTPAPDAGPPAPPRAAREPFWGYSDVAVFAGLLVASFLVAVALVTVTASLSRSGLRSNFVLETLAMQVLIYILAFSALALLFRVQYGQPFWSSLGWTRFRMSPPLIVLFGLLTAFGVAVLGVLLRTPATRNRITDMLADPRAFLLLLVFGITLAPVSEELIFRGFLQPLFVRSLGAVAGVFAAAVPFGLLHYREYGNSWRHALLISMAGAAFGWMRQRTGSTKSSSLMHASYNAVEFITYYFAQRGAGG